MKKLPAIEILSLQFKLKFITALNLVLVTFLLFYDLKIVLHKFLVHIEGSSYVLLLYLSVTILMIQV